MKSIDLIDKLQIDKKEEIKNRYDQEHDLSFIYKIAWKRPRKQIKEAFQILLGQKKLEHSEQLETVKKLAANPKTPPAVLNDLANTKYLSVKNKLAENTNLSPSTLIKLAEEGDKEIYSLLAERDDLPTSVVYKLMKCEDTNILLSLAENHHIPRYVLRELIKHENPYVVSRAQKTLERLRKENSIPLLIHRTIKLFTQAVLGSKVRYE